MRPEIPACPSCGRELVIRRFECPDCALGIDGAFTRNRFSRLSATAQEFLLLFVKTRGNLREIERELQLSYPTVRNRLDAVIRELGLEAGSKWSLDEIARERRTILEELDQGKLAPEDAEELLKALAQIDSASGETKR